MFAAAIRLFYLAVTRAPQFKAPIWVAYVLGLVFFAGGARLLEIASGRAGRGEWVGFIFFAGFGAVLWWISYNGDPGDCGMSVGSVGVAAIAPCQIGEAFFALFSTALAIYFARRLFSARGKL
jgi:hypothetical protein